MISCAITGLAIPTVEAACDNVTVWGVKPETVVVMVATRMTLVGFAEYVAITEPFPLPEEGATVHHAALLTDVHVVFEVTVMVAVPAEAGTFWLAGPTVRIGAAPAWVTVTV